MAFRSRARMDYERVFPRINPRPHDRSVDGVALRVVGKMTEVFVGLMEQENARSTPPAYFANAALASVANILAVSIRDCIQAGRRREILKEVLNMIREQVEPRLETDASVPVFHIGLDPDAGERRSKEGN